MTRAAYLGDHTSLVRTIFGRKMYVDTRDTVVSPHLLIDGDWEPWIREFLQRTLTKGMRFVDVGAHLGWYTLLARELVGPEGTVHSFEPNPSHAALLRRSLMINGFHAEVRTAACSDRADDKLYAVDPEFSGNGRLVECAGARGESFCVRTERLDEVVREADFVKIDAEGHESRVLAGMTGLIAASPRVQILVEHHDPSNVEAFEGERAELAKLLKGGFQLGVVEHDGFLSELRLEKLGDVPDSEMLFLRR